MKKRKFRLENCEIRIIVKALIEMKNQLLAAGKYTDAVDDILVKLLK